MFGYVINCVLIVMLLTVIPALAWVISQKIIFGLLILNKDEAVDEMSTKFKRYERMFNYMLDIR